MAAGCPPALGQLTVGELRHGVIEPREPDVIKGWSADPRCQLRPERGPCKALFTKFHFDRVKQACVPFFYGGCEGVVPFETREQCESACLKKPTDAP